MGYSTDSRGRLCCDGCGASGSSRRYKCPFGYCQSDILCTDCARKYKVERSKEGHQKRGCENFHNRFVAEEQRKADLLAQGKAVRCSASGLDGGIVHVLFRKADDSTVGYYMSNATYDAVGILEPATPEDFGKFGEIREAPGAYQNGRTTKQVTLP